MNRLTPHTMDYAAINSVIHELAAGIEGSRLQRAVAVGPLGIVLEFGIEGGWLSLFISADARHSRIHLLERPEIPKDAPKVHICNMLNERDRGALVESVEVVEWERIVRFTFVTSDGDGDEGKREDTLVAELMGKHSNIILVDNDGMILGSLKAIHSHQSSKRQVRAGLMYELPPAEDKLTPKKYSLDEFESILKSIPCDNEIAGSLVRTFKAMSPSWAGKISGCAGIEPGATMGKLSADEIARLHKCFLGTLRDIEGGRPLDIEPGDGEFPINAAYAQIYSGLSTEDVLEKRRSRLLKLIRDMRKSSEKLRGQIEEDLKACEKREELRRKADAVLAALHEIPKGAKSIELPDIHSAEGAKITVALDPSIPPAKVAQKWYERYNKLKRGETENRKRLNEINERFEVLVSAEDEARDAEDVPMLESAAARLEAAGIEVKFQKGGEISQRPSGKTYKVLRFRSSDGFEILAGGNQKANEYLTQRLADKEDIWLHAQKFAGSHVIIRARHKEVPQSTLIDAAHIAAWHSEARESSKVPVDYTRVKHVSKPPGSKPGYVTYKRQRTIRVDPDERRVLRMSIKEGI